MLSFKHGGNTKIRKILMRYCYMLFFIFILPVGAMANNTNANNNSLEINVIGSSLALTQEHHFYAPSLVDKINLLGTNEPTLSTNLGDIVRKSSSLQITGGPRRLAQNLTMRGFNKNGLIVLVDDVPVSFLSQHVNFFPVSLMSVTNVEVLKGAISSIYGSNAIGGVVSFKTIDGSDFALPEGKRLGTIVSAGYSSAKKEFDVSGTTYLRNQNSDFLGNLNFMHSKDTRTGQNNKVTVAESDQQTSGILKTRFFSDTQELGLSYYFTLDQATILANPEVNPTGARDDTNIEHRMNIQSHTARLSHQFKPHEYSWAPSMSTVMYFKYVDHQETPKVNFPTFPGAQPWYLKGDNLGKINYTIGGNHKESLNLPIHDLVWSNLTYGVNYIFQDQKRHGTDPRGLLANASSHNLGAFVQDELFITDYVTLLGGVRYDYFNLERQGQQTKVGTKTVNTPDNKDYNKFSPKVSLTVKPANFMMIYGSYSKAFKVPDLNEMYSEGLHFKVGKMVNYVLPNPNLRPTTSNTVEAGYGFNFEHLPLGDGKLSFKQAIYNTSAQDFITLKVDIKGGTSQYINIANVHMYGTDLIANYESTYFNTKLAYSYTDARDEDLRTKLLNISRHTVKWTGELNLPDYHWFVGGNVLGQSAFYVYTSSKNKKGETIYTSVRNPGFATFGLYTGFNVADARVSFGVDNIFDKLYVEPFSSLPAAGRSYKVLLTMKL